MNARVFALVSVCAVLAACRREPPPPPVTAAPPAVTRPTPVSAPPAVATPAQPSTPAPVQPMPKEVDTFVISMALQNYVEQRNVNPLTITDLNVLVRERFLPHLPPPPPGKKYVWNRNLSVTLADK